MTQHKVLRLVWPPHVGNRSCLRVKSRPAGCWLLGGINLKIRQHNMQWWFWLFASCSQTGHLAKFHISQLQTTRRSSTRWWLFAECCGWSEEVRDTSGLCRDSPIRISRAEIFDALPTLSHLTWLAWLRGLGHASCLLTAFPNFEMGNKLQKNTNEDNGLPSPNGGPPYHQCNYLANHLPKFCALCDLSIIIILFLNIKNIEKKAFLRTSLRILNICSRCNLEGLSGLIIIGSNSNFSISSHPTNAQLADFCRARKSSCCPHPEVTRAATPCVESFAPSGHVR